MKITLLFYNINAYNGLPKIRISINNNMLYEGEVGASYQFDIEPAQLNTLQITHYDKSPIDTLVENGTIVADKNFTLEKVIIDEYDIEELIWNSVVVGLNDDTIPGCLFFGPNGTFTLKFEAPILKWILKSRQEKNNNDSAWEEDYNYFVEASRLIKEIT